MRNVLEYPNYRIDNPRRLVGRKIFSKQTSYTYILTKLQNDDRTFYCECVENPKSSGHLDCGSISNVIYNEEDYVRDIFNDRDGIIWLLPKAEKKEFKI